MSQPHMVSPAARAGALRSGSGGRALGLLLLLPAVLAWIVYQVLPVVRTLVHSVRDGGFDGPAAYVGLDHFSRLPGTWFSSVLGKLLLGLLIAAVAVAVGIGIGSLVQRAPRGWQRATLAVIGLALVGYAPINLTIALFWDGTQDAPGTARLLLAMLPVPLLIGALAGALARSGRILLVIGAVVALGGAAWAVQGDSGLVVPHEWDSGGLIYRTTFVNFDVGLGAAASMVLGALLGVLGLGAGLMLVAIRPRFDLIGERTRSMSSTAPFASPPGQLQQPGYAPQPGPAAQPGPDLFGGPAGPSGYGLGRPGAGTAGKGILAVVGAAAVLTVLVLLALPWLRHLGDEVMGGDPADAARVTWATVGRHTLGVAITAGVTGAAAFGLGYLRPFGRHSLRVLIVFSPWLFVGLVPLMTGLFFHLSGGYGDSPFFGITARLLAVPLLFLLAYLADGLRTARDGGHSVRKVQVLGLVLLFVGALAVARGQQVVGDVVGMVDPDSSAVLYLVQAVMYEFGGSIPLSMLTPVPLLVVGALVLAVAAALIPGVRLLPAAELADRLPGNEPAAGLPATYPPHLGGSPQGSPQPPTGYPQQPDYAQPPTGYPQEQPDYAQPPGDHPPHQGGDQQGGPRTHQGGDQQGGYPQPWHGPQG